MKLHLPVLLRKSVLSCLATVGLYTMGSSVVWADNLTFDGTTLIWNTSEDNKSFADENDAPAAFAAGDNVSFSGESTVTLGEDISAGTVAIEKGADVTIDLDVFELNVDRIELSGLLDMGYSLNIGAGTTLAMNGAGAVLDSNLVLGEKGVLTVTGAGGSLGGHSLTLQEGASLILTGAVISRETTDVDLDGELSLIVTPTGDGKTYTLLTGVSELVDKYGNSLTVDSYSTDELFDSSLPGSGFWAGGTLVYAADGTLTLVRHNETVKDALEVTTRQTGNVDYSYYAGISFKNLTTTDSEGCAIYGGRDSTITLSNNGSVVFEGNTASSSSYASGGAIYGGRDSTITLSDNGSVVFVGNSGGAIYGYDGSSTITLSNNGSVVFEGNSGGAIWGIYTTTLSNNGSVVFVGNTASSGGAISEEAITLSNNGSVVFEGNTASSSSYASGGAIFGSGDIMLSNNGSVVFEGNTASGISSASGGAVVVASWSTNTFTLSNNGSVVFSRNKASSSSSARGGAIVGAGDIMLSNNGSVVFSGNTVSSSDAEGGAIYDNFGRTIALSNNGSVVFSENTASGTSSATGGAFVGAYGGWLSLYNNGSVVFSGNTASGTSSATGGAIFETGSIMLSNNGSVVFEGNTASGTSSATGGAIHIQPGGGIVIRNNQSVVFKGNYTLNSGALRLQSIYALDSGDTDSLAVCFGAPENGSIEFRDSIHIEVNLHSSSAFDLNDRHGAGIGGSPAQTGDIIFTGEDANAEYLQAILDKHGLTASDEQMSEYIAASRTSEINGVAQLHDGRLIIRDGAVLAAGGIKVLSSTSGTSTPTLWLHDGELTYYQSRNALSFASGTAFALSRQNAARNTTITFEGGSSFIITLDAMHAATAALTLTNSTLTLPTTGTLTLQLNAGETLTQGKSYALLTGISQPIGWSNSTITVTSGTSGWDVSWEDLSWVDNTLWLYYDARPDLEIATWTNESKDGKWNTTSLNWEQNEVDYEYKDGVAVVFGNTGADTVTLVGNIAPKSVLVDSAEDYTWEADPTEGGKLTGSMALTKQGAGTLHIQTSNDYTGGTVIEGGKLVAGTATALGTGSVVLNGGALEIGAAGLLNSISNRGTSTLRTSAGITHVLIGTISNTGTLKLSGSFDASALDYETNATDERYALDGSVIGADKSGFAVGVTYQVKVIDGGTVINDKTTILHDSHAGSNALVLGADGYARANGDGHYSHYFLTNGDAVSVGEIAQVATGKNGILTNVNMDSGSLTVDQSIIVSATDGSIAITKAATLDGSIEDTAVSTAAGSYSAEIRAMMKGDTTLEINGGEITVSGANSYMGGTQVNGGALMAGNAKAFGTGDVVVNGATLDLNRFSVANKVVMNGSSTLGYADGASHIVLGSGAAVNFRNGYTLGSGKRLTVAGPVSYTGTLTLGGGTLELDGLLKVQGDVVFASGATTTLDISGWKGLDDGDVLADFGSSNSGYADGCLSLEGIAGEWDLAFEASTGVLTLVAVKDEPLPEPEFAPNLTPNQQVVYDTIKDIMGEGKPSGLLGQQGKEVTGIRDEEKLKQLLDALGGAEYATLMSSQQDAARGHMRRLRGSMGSGYALAGTKTRAYIEAYTNRSEVDGDASGRGYEMTENGGQFALEFLGEDKVSGGFAVASGRSKLQPEVGLTQKSSNTYVDAFLVRRDGAYTGKTSLGVGVHSYDLERQVMGNAVRAQADGSSVNFMHESAYATALDESSSVQVFGAVESSMGKLGAFHEKGADTASLEVESQDAWVTTLSAGARYHYNFAVVDAAPAATLSLQTGLEYKLGDTESEVEMSFSGARSHAFRQSGSKRDRFGYNVGASLHVPVSSHAAVYASGDAVLRGDSSEVNANLGVQVAF